MTDKLRAMPVVGFVLRYWLIISLIAAFACLIFSNKLFAVVGMLVYLPALFIGAMAQALLARNILNNDTTDKSARTGQIKREWAEMDGKTRVILTKIEFLVYLLCASLITAALALR